MEKILDMVNKNVQMHKKFQDTKNKPINELRGDLNKHQDETEDTIKRDK
jgi:hypothetical protein